MHEKDKEIGDSFEENMKLREFSNVDNIVKMRI